MEHATPDLRVVGWNLLKKIIINYKVLQSAMEATWLGREAEVKRCDFNATDNPQTDFRIIGYSLRVPRVSL